MVIALVGNLTLCLLEFGMVIGCCRVVRKMAAFMSWRYLRITGDPDG
jgi:hypothetical protein